MFWMLLGGKICFDFEFVSCPFYKIQIDFFRVGHYMVINYSLRYAEPFLLGFVGSYERFHFASHIFWTGSTN